MITNILLRNSDGGTTMTTISPLLGLNMHKVHITRVFPQNKQQISTFVLDDEKQAKALLICILCGDIHTLDIEDIWRQNDLASFFNV
jgi:hypothetical protein